MSKVIKSFDLNLSDLSASKQNRAYTIYGDEGAEFRLEIKNEDGRYYNFYTRAFAGSNPFQSIGLDGTIQNGTYEGSITFPLVSDNDQYDIYLFAKAGTVHSDYNESRFKDGSININGSTGSNSLVMQKVIYQYTDLTLSLTAFSPNSTIDVSSATTSSITIPRGKGKAKTAFSISLTAPAFKAYQILKQPTTNDILSFVTRTVGSDPENLPGEPKKATAYQWPLDDVNRLKEGMIVLGDNVSTGATIQEWLDTVTILENTEKEEIIIKNQAPGVNTNGQKPTITNGHTALQPGNIVFSAAQSADLADDEIKIGGYGIGSIEDIFGFTVDITDLAISIDTVTTTTTSAVVNSASIPVASVVGIVPGTTTVSGMGINPSVADPVVNSTGVGTLNLSATQNLESGVTLTFGGGGGQVATITGNIEVKSSSTSSAVLRFDVEKLLSTT